MSKSVIIKILVRLKNQDEVRARKEAKILAMAMEQKARQQVGTGGGAGAEAGVGAGAGEGAGVVAGAETGNIDAQAAKDVKARPAPSSHGGYMGIPQTKSGCLVLIFLTLILIVQRMAQLLYGARAREDRDKRRRRRGTSTR